MKVRLILAWVFFTFGLIILSSVVLVFIYSWYSNWVLRPSKLFDPTKVAIYPIPKFLNSRGIYEDIKMSDSNAWFPGAQTFSEHKSPVSQFLVNIPGTTKDITVQVNGTDLNYQPIHYPGTALPGEIGNTVILGHSALPQFYLLGSNWTVFNPLVKSKIGDLIKVQYNGKNLVYKVKVISEVSPDQVEVLNQPSNKRELTLITCVPLGTYLRRLVVVGDLVKEGD